MQIQKITKSYKNLIDKFKYLSFEETTSFNLFFLISSQYQKENLHSDFLASLLNPRAGHNCGSLFLDHFFDYLTNIGINIDKSLYTDAEICREKGRIDISINAKTMHAIIIENKINYAGDMPGQIPRYVSFLRKKGYVIDCILYITIDGQKRPDENTWKSEIIKEHWSEEQVEEVSKKVIPISAFYDSPNDLYNGFFGRLSTINVYYLKTVIEHYRQLLFVLGARNMNLNTMKEFYDRLTHKSDDFNEIITLHDMVNELPLFRLKHYIDYFNPHKGKFKRVDNYQNWVVFFHQFGDGELNNLKIHIIPEKSRTKIELFQQNNDDPDRVKKIIEMIGEKHEYSYVSGSRFERYFLFPDEEHVMKDYIKALLNKLETYDLS